MRKKIIVSLLVFVSLFTLVGCGKSKESNKYSSKIELGKKQKINQLEKIQIGDTDDYLIITEKRKWEIPEKYGATTVSFVISIPYTLHVDGKDYSSEYLLGDYSKKGDDGNPKYDFEITNLTKNYETEVIIKEK